MHIDTDGHAHTLINTNKETKVYGEIFKAHLSGLFLIVAIAVVIDKPWNFLIFLKSLYSEVDIPIYLVIKALSNALQRDRVCCCLCGLHYRALLFRNQNRKCFKIQENRSIICLILL